MALKYRKRSRGPVIKVTGQAVTDLVTFLNRIGVATGTACELRVWFEAPASSDPRSGTLSAQAEFVESEDVLVGTPPSGAFEIFNG